MCPLEGDELLADRGIVRLRLQCERGFGLVELLIAMVMLNVGILAIVAAFNSGMFALKRASRISTATALADKQMELYRALPYASISLDSTTIPTGAPYTTDSAYSSTQVTATCTGSPLPDECTASRTVTNAQSPDHKRYRVDTYIVLSTATTTPPTPPNGRPLKIVTVVVRDGYNVNARPLVREASTFDASTG
jgi:Tfp pilus assembly protein PilV